MGECFLYGQSGGGGSKIVTEEGTYKFTSSGKTSWSQTKTLTLKNIPQTIIIRFYTKITRSIYDLYGSVTYSTTEHYDFAIWDADGMYYKTDSGQIQNQNQEWGVGSVGFTVSAKNVSIRHSGTWHKTSGDSTTGTTANWLAIAK